MRRIIAKSIAAVACTVTLATAAMSQQGPVATACKDDLKKFCAGKEHGQGEVRACLESNRDKVSAACKTALDNTGPGKGMGAGQK